MTEDDKVERRVGLRRADDARGRPVYSHGPIVLLLSVASAAAALAAIAALVFALSAQQSQIDQQREGRRFAVAAICAFDSAVGQAGYDTIVQSQLAESPLTRFLEHHGYPPLSVRRAQAVAQGRAYVRQLTRRELALAGVTGKQLVRADGSLDCARLTQLAVTRPDRSR